MQYFVRFFWCISGHIICIYDFNVVNKLIKESEGFSHPLSFIGGIRYALRKEETKANLIAVIWKAYCLLI